MEGKRWCSCGRGRKKRWESRVQRGKKKEGKKNEVEKKLREKITEERGSGGDGGGDIVSLSKTLVLSLSSCPFF